MKSFFLINKSIFKRQATFIMIAITTILLVLLFLLSNFSLIILNYINDYRTKNIDCRTLLINDFYDSIDLTLISNIKYVNQVIKLNDSYVYIHSNEYDTINLIALNSVELNNLKIIDGKKELGNYNIICPREFIPVDEVENINISNKTFDTSKLINKSFDVTLNRVEYKVEDEEFHKNIIDTKTEKFTIIANYNSNLYMLENNICFASIEDVKSIVDFVDVQDDEQYSPTYMIIVDDINNMDSVRIELEKLGYTAFDKVTSDKLAAFILGVIVISVLIAIIFIFWQVIRLNIKRDITYKEKEILLYKSIGYSNKNIMNIYLEEYFIIFMIATIVSFVISFLSFNLLKEYLSKYYMYKLLDMIIYPLPILLVVLIGLVFSMSIVIIKIRKILKIKRIVI